MRNIIDALNQYSSMEQEARDLRERIERDEWRLARMATEGGEVSDTVKGTRRDGTIGTIRITGFPLPEYDRIRAAVRKRSDRLRVLEADLLEALNEADDFINSIPDSELRMMFRLYYIDDLTWVQVAGRMNRAFPKRSYTADGCRKRHDRFLEDKI